MLYPAGFLCSQHNTAFGERFRPHQLGVGVSRGPDIFAAVVKLALQAHPDWIAAKLDDKNAFNMCSRRAFLLSPLLPAHMSVLVAAADRSDLQQLDQDGRPSKVSEGGGREE